MEHPESLTVSFVLTGSSLAQLQSDAEEFVGSIRLALADLAGEGVQLWGLSQGVSGSAEALGTGRTLHLEYAVEATFRMRGDQHGRAPSVRP